MSKATKSKAVEQDVVIQPPNIQTAEFKLEGTAPYVQNKFSEKARGMMMAKQAAGSVAKKGSKREAKDFDLCFEQAQHIDEDGTPGIPAPAFRSAMISACRLVGFKMTVAKLSVFVMPDGIDKDDGTPLVHLLPTKPEKHTAAVRNETGVCDIRVRPMWRKWGGKLRVRYDADQFTLADVSNLLARAGEQVGVGEGRPDSKKSHGMGWGTWRVA